MLCIMEFKVTSVSFEIKLTYFYLISLLTVILNMLQEHTPTREMQLTTPPVWYEVLFIIDIEGSVNSQPKHQTD